MRTPAPQPVGAAVRLGLRENLGQFALLVVVNAFVGAMVGLERSMLPAMAEHEFQLAARVDQSDRQFDTGGHEFRLAVLAALARAARAHIDQGPRPG